jgi:phage-related protein
LLVAQGRAVIDGLLSGIRSGVQAMYNFVSGIAAGIAARKGPLDYDRKVLVPAGLALMQGLSTGLTRGYGDVLTQVAGMASGISGQLVADVGSLGTLNPAGVNLPATAAQTAAALRATPSPNVQVTVKIGETELRGIVDTQVETTNREVARIVGAGAGR